MIVSLIVMTAAGIVSAIIRLVYRSGGWEDAVVRALYPKDRP